MSSPASADLPQPSRATAPGSGPESAPSSARGRRPGLAAGVRTVLARELSGWFDAPIAWLAVAAASAASTAWFMNGFFLAGRVDMSAFFEALPFLYLAFVPALAMRLWSEDLRTRTFELWMTLPLRPAQIVAGKFLAASCVLAAFLACTLGIVVLLAALGDADLARIACGYAGAFLLGALLLAIGGLCSALTADQVLAYVATALVGAALVALGDARVVAVVDGWAPALQLGSALERSIALAPHYEAFVAGTVPLRSLAWFLGLIAAALAVNAWSVARERA